MVPQFSFSSNIFIIVLLIIPVFLIGCVTPIFVLVDKIRSNSKTDFYDRWLYNGSTETSICLLSFALLLSVATSTKPITYFFSEMETYKLHTIEQLSLAGAIFFVLVMTAVVLFRYGLNKNGKDSQNLFLASCSTSTLLAPGLYYFFFRMPWEFLK